MASSVEFYATNYDNFSNLHRYICANYKGEIIKATCYTCEKLFRSNSMEGNKPVACSKECKTEEFKKDLLTWWIANRGYPPGFSSKDHYETYLLENTITEKRCQCGCVFLGKSEIYLCSACTEQNRMTKIFQTKKDRYGSEGYNNRDKAKETCLEKYGVDNPRKNDYIKRKAKETCLEKYGVDNPSKNKEVLDKIASSHYAKYGVSNVFKRTDLMKEYWLHSLGVDNPLKRADISKRAYETRTDLYTLLGAVPKDASERTCLHKFGNKSFFGSDIGNMNYENLRTAYDWTEENLAELSSRKDSSSFSWALKKANGDVALANEIFIKKTRGTSAPGKASASSMLVFSKLVPWLKDNYNISDSDLFYGAENKKEYFLYDQTCRRLYLYDFTLKKQKIIIEFNGCYWNPRTKEEDLEKWVFDQRKAECAKENGFQVIVVRDDVPAEVNVDFLKERLAECLIM